MEISNSLFVFINYNYGIIIRKTYQRSRDLYFQNSHCSSLTTLADRDSSPHLLFSLIEFEVMHRPTSYKF